MGQSRWKVWEAVRDTGAEGSCGIGVAAFEVVGVIVIIFWIGERLEFHGTSAILGGVKRGGCTVKIRFLWCRGK